MEPGYCFFPVWFILAISGIEYCSSLGLGVTRVYQYETEVIAGDQWPGQKNPNKDLGYRISGDVHVTTVWENRPQGEELVKIQFENLEIRRSNKDSKVISRPSKLPLFVENVGSDLRKIYSRSETDLYVKSLLKGVASILHFRKDTTKVTEKDVSGTCDTSYHASIVTGGKKIEKIKENCRCTEDAPVRGNGLRSAFVTVSSRTTYALDGNDAIQEASVSERIDIASNLWKDGKATIRAQTKLQQKEDRNIKDFLLSIENLENAVAGLKQKYKAEFLEDNIVADVPPAKTPQKKHDLAQLAKSYQKSLKTENLAKLSSTSAFLKLLKHFKNCPEAEIKQILENKKMQAVLPQLLDLMAFGGTSATADVVFKTFQKNGQTDLMERFLLSLSLITHPTEDLLQVMLNFLKDEKSEKLKASAISTLGALLKTMNSRSVTGNKGFQDAVDTLEKGLKDCKSDACALMYLRGLRNAALQSTKPLLIETAGKGGRPAFEAVLALKNIGFRDNPSECERFCQKILHSTKPKQDTSTKAVVAEILLDCSVASPAPLQRFLATLAAENQTEYSAFMASKLTRKMEQNQELKLQVFNFLSDKSVANLFSLFHSGSSASFMKPLIAAGEVNSSYGVDMEMLAGGLLKRSSFDIDLQSKEENVQLIRVGIFADGMASFVGESESEDEDESPRAGLELSVMGVALRPYVFFESTSELMSHVWSGTASEPTPALQGNFLLTDHSEAVVLQNGLVTRLLLQGVLSTDLSGAVQISIWNRNSNSQVQNGAAFLMMAYAGVDTLHDTVEDEIIYRGETKIDFINQFEFYEAPYKMCLQMIQPEFKFLIDRKKSVKLDGGKIASKKTLKTKFLVPSKSYALHPKNSEFCSQMLSENY